MFDAGDKRQLFVRKRIGPIELDAPASMYRRTGSPFDLEEHRRRGIVFGPTRIRISRLAAASATSIAQSFRAVQVGPRGLCVTVLRAGPTSIRESCTEILQRCHNPEKTIQGFEWALIFCESGQWIDFSIFADETFADPEDYWARVIRSIRVLPESEQLSLNEELPRPSSRRKRGLSARARERLQKAMAALPPELEYLRPPILLLAELPPDQLQPDTADIQPLCLAIEQEVRRSSPATIAQHAELLESWIDDVSEVGDTWSAPLRFAQAFLSGYEFYGNDQ